MNGCWLRVKFVLSALSAGKYHTKFYHQGRSYQSHWLGGLFTLLLGLVVLCIGVSTLIEVINAQDYVLQKTARMIQAYDISKLNNPPQECSNCAEVTVKDFIQTFSEMQFIVTMDTTIPERNLNCSQFEAKLFMRSQLNSS